jgi:hypothetical protein
MKYKRPFVFALAVLVAMAVIATVVLSPDARLRRQVNRLTFQVGDVYDSTLTNDENTARRTAAFHLLGPKAVEVLISEFEQQDTFLDRVRQRIHRSGPDWLSRRMSGMGTVVKRIMAGHAIALLGENATPAIPALIAGLSRSDINTPTTAARSLAILGTTNAQAIAALESLTNSAQPRLSLLVGIALWRAQPDNTNLVYFVNASLATNDWLGIQYARQIFAYVKPEVAQPFVSGFRMGISNYAPPSVVAKYILELEAAKALWRIDGSADVSLLALSTLTNAAAMRTLPSDENPDEMVCNLVHELGEIPEFCVAVKPILETMQTANNPSLKRECADALQIVNRTLRTRRTTAPITSGHTTTLPNN